MSIQALCTFCNERVYSCRNDGRLKPSFARGLVFSVKQRSHSGLPKIYQAYLLNAHLQSTITAFFILTLLVISLILFKTPARRTLKWKQKKSWWCELRLQSSTAKDQFLPESDTNASKIAVNFHIVLLQTEQKQKLILKKAFVFRTCLMDVSDTEAKIKHGWIKQ